MGRVVGGITFDAFDENEPKKPLDGEELEKVVNDDIERFQNWFCENVDTSGAKLSGIEVAIIKTYLWYKLHPGEKPSGETSSR